MTEHDDELELVLRPWMQRHAPAAPSELVLRIYGEIEAMPEHAPSRGWLSRFAAWPAAWAATAAVAVVLLVAGAMLVSFSRLPAVGDQPTPTPTISPAPSGAAATADTLITAWNSGDVQQVAGLYDHTLPSSAPIVRFMIDSGAPTQQLALADLPAAVTTWHAAGTVMTRTGDVLAQGPYAAYPVTWTASDGSFNGVEVLRLTAGGLVSEQYLIGASSTTANGTAAGTEVVASIHDGMQAIAARLGASSADLFALTAEVHEFQEGAGSGDAIGRAAIAAIFPPVPAPSTAHVGSVVTQGPFAVYGASNPTTSGAVEQGFTVLELSADGSIQGSWAIRAETAIAPSPAASGG